MALGQGNTITNQNRHAPPHAGVAEMIPSATAAGLTPIGLAAPIHAPELQAALDRAALDITVRFVDHEVMPYFAIECAAGLWRVHSPETAREIYRWCVSQLSAPRSSPVAGAQPAAGAPS